MRNRHVPVVLPTCHSVCYSRYKCVRVSRICTCAFLTDLKIHVSHIVTTKGLNGTTLSCATQACRIWALQGLDWAPIALHKSYLELSVEKHFRRPSALARFLPKCVASCFAF